MISNGNSFGKDCGDSIGTAAVGEPGTIRAAPAIGWMFPGGSSGIQALCNRM